MTTRATGQKSYNCQEDSDIPVADNYIIFQDYISCCQEAVINLEQLIEHHVKYKEIHGVDETIWMTRSEHLLLHARLRREGKCKVNPKKLREISHAACGRTEKAKNQVKAYSETKEAKIAALKFSRDLEKRSIKFCNFAGSFVSLIETIVYTKSGDILVSSGFTTAHGVKLFRCNE